MLFRPVYLRTQPLLLHTPKTVVVKLPTPEKQPTPPPPGPPAPPPEPPQPPKEVSKTVEAEEVKHHLPMLVCGKGLTRVFPEEATMEVLAGEVDYLLVDERGVTLFQRKNVATAMKINKEYAERKKKSSCTESYQRLLDRKPREFEIANCELLGGGVHGTDFSWSRPRSQRAMSSGSLFRGYTGPRA